MYLNNISYHIRKQIFITGNISIIIYIACDIRVADL